MSLQLIIKFELRMYDKLMTNNFYYKGTLLVTLLHYDCLVCNLRGILVLSILDKSLQFCLVPYCI